jgi:hypothetical protein
VATTRPDDSGPADRDGLSADARKTFARRALRRFAVKHFGDPPDPAWRKQTPVPRFTGYDPDLARQGVERARARATRIRRAHDGPKRPT